MSHPPAKLNAFPVFMRVEGRRVVVVGNGDEALAKARLVGQSNARLVVVADRVEERLRQWIAENGAGLIEQAMSRPVWKVRRWSLPRQPTRRWTERISADARRIGIAVNAVDRPDLCDFYTPAIVNRAPLVVAVGTEGAAPVLAQLVRARIDAMLPPALGLLASLAGSFRDAAERLLPKGVARRSFWHAFFSGAPARALDAGGERDARAAASQLLAEQGASPVTLRWSAPALARKTC